MQSFQICYQWYRNAINEGELNGAKNEEYNAGISYLKKFN